MWRETRLLLALDIFGAMGKSTGKEDPSHNNLFRLSNVFHGTSKKNESSWMET